MSPLTRIFLLLLSLAFLAACGADAPKPEPLTVALEAYEFEFKAPAVAVRENQPVTLHFENKGVIDHELAIDEWGVETDLLRPGESQTVTFTPRKTGTFSFYCAVPGHTAAGMAGTITITP
ncbi:MAG: cupredoxin domain-containing protein [Chloroflexi bacterium]|nr:cupredoxin domain-containing protein [Chloroflexota bacterium]MCI0577479.1 cupredoxin domain-containing protein [Chloroflexota bacterium]MCI0647670.1 cupredoxin domain-containing protein [Chloroflexota bacterium]MCI0730100.1 cupredoxin domain-containing protein [Chloroflexota bacterium]